MTSGENVRIVAELPSFRDAIRGAADDLSNGRSVAFVYPVDFEANWYKGNLQSYLFDRHVKYGSVAIAKMENEVSCAGRIARCLGIGEPSGYWPETPAALMSSTGLPDVIIIEPAPYAMSEESLLEWSDFLKKWATLSHQKANSGEPFTAIFFPFCGNLQPMIIPPSDLYLSVRYLWGAPSLLEMRLLCRQMSRKSGIGFDSLWDEYVLSSIAMSDINLLIHLLKSGPENINARILNYARQKWNRDSMDISDLSTSNQSIGVYGLSPPVNILNQWSRGFIGFVPERGIFIHTSVLAKIECWSEIRHRIWAGQAELLLPLIDSARLKICNLLTERFGKSWPTTWISPQFEGELELVKNDPRYCQWGHLFQICKYANPVRKIKNLLKVIDMLRIVRNDLAHYRKINTKKLNDINNAIELLEAI